MGHMEIWLLGFAAIGFLSVLFTSFVVLFCIVATLNEWIRDVLDYSRQHAKRLDGPIGD